MIFGHFGRFLLSVTMEMYLIMARQQKVPFSHTDVIYAASIFPLLNYDFSQKFEWL